MTFWGWSSDPFQGLSDLQLGDEKVTLNHLVYFIAEMNMDSRIHRKVGRFSWICLRCLEKMKHIPQMVVKNSGLPW